MNKIGFQANLFIIVLILLISITIFISCEKDNYTGLSKENLYGKWIGPTTMKVFDFETQMAKPINNIFEFKSNGLCSIKTPEFNFNFGIDCHPDIGSKWDIISNENTIIFYYIPDPGINLPKWRVVLVGKWVCKCLFVFLISLLRSPRKGGGGRGGAKKKTKNSSFHSHPQACPPDTTNA
ncbi:MAG: hypothetical protein IPG79_15085 [Saprospiraceae bacterium]|nr:hypothetical protein [Saprospiraceae bacterium]